MDDIMDNYLTTEQVATRLKLHQNTVIRWIRDGRLPAQKVGKSYRIRESVVADLMGETGESPGRGATIICVANQKGGVAKTTTAVNLASCLAEEGKRVLLIDLDPQGGCAVCLGIDTSSFQRTIYNVLLDPNTDLAKVVVPTKFGFDLAPSNIDLAGAEVELREVLAQETVLKRNLAGAIDKYDYVLIDTPPSLSILTANALTAAHYVLVPVSCEHMTLRALTRLFDMVRDVRAATNPGLQFLGIVLTKYDARTLNSREVHEYITELSDRMGIKLFNSVIKETVRFKEAPNAGTPLVNLHPDLDVAQAYRQVAKEIAYG